LFRWGAGVGVDPIHMRPCPLASGMATDLGCGMGQEIGGHSTSGAVAGGLSSTSCRRNVSGCSASSGRRDRLASRGARRPRVALLIDRGQTGFDPGHYCATR
jgi:hypothetical protein